MNRHAARRQTPEERELERKHAELATLESELADRELEFVTLQAELQVFEARYLRTVGRLYAELDDLEAQIAEAEARQHPREDRLRDQAARARATAEESAYAVSTIVETPENRFTPSDDLRTLYREVARQIHPDLATNETDRARGTAAMAEANKAYAAGDEAKLRAILDDWHSSPEAVEGEGVAAELVRTIRKIHQVQRRLAELANALTTLRHSDLYRLKERADAASAVGQDLFSEMADQLSTEISALWKRLDLIRKVAAT
ncbi:MAG: molecular chaperone DnaJ [Acidobacteria bacterium]|nr:molecular chaperone DnaJ [Acidobacteriota bacterium]MBI3049075.1 molecular chaperone DnaJ [Acidobacteriota bacterium]